MRGWLGRWSGGRQRGPGEGVCCLVVDWGTTVAKAALVRLGSPPHVVAVARREWPWTAAPLEAPSAESAGLVGELLDEVQRLAGEFDGPVAGLLLGLGSWWTSMGIVRSRLRRRTAAQPVSRPELRGLVGQAQRAALAEARRRLGSMPSSNWELVGTYVVGLRLEGETLAPDGWQAGAELEVTLAYALVPPRPMAIVRRLAKRAGAHQLAVAPEALALALALSPEGEPDQVLLIDVGGAWSGVTLIEQSAPTGEKLLGFGGRAFTRSLASAFGLPWEEAERLKCQFAAGGLPQELGERVAAVLRRDVSVWQAGVTLAWDELAPGRPVPRRGFLLGGGAPLVRPSQWPSTSTAAAAKAAGEGQAPWGDQLHLVEAAEVAGDLDPLGLLRGPGDVVLAALARQAVARFSPTD